MTGSKSKYRIHLPSPEDTTIGGGQKILTPGFLRLVGELLYGERWQTPLAQSLGKLRGKRLAPATIHRWTTERRSIPDWVEGALAILLEQGQEDLQRRAGMARAIAKRLGAAVFREGPTLMNLVHKERGQSNQDSLR